MKIAVLGTGMVGQALAGKLAELGHDVTVGTRDVGATKARTEPDSMGNPPYAAWAASHPLVGLATFAQASGGAELMSTRPPAAYRSRPWRRLADKTWRPRCCWTPPTRWTSRRVPAHAVRQGHRLTG